MDEESFNKYTRVKAIKDFSGKVAYECPTGRTYSSTWLLRILNWVDNSIYGIIQTVVTRYIDP
ncbi:hypothetical protein KY289_017343 [Solanum tuberosum]|nr:hypothetical protein KY289_017343 [Solanum tuberosum]